MFFDQRRLERYDLSDRIEYVLDPFTEDEIFEGIAINFNSSGLCLLVTKPLTEDQEITINSNIPFSSRTAKVHWIKKYDDIYYQTGLLFV